MAITYFPSDVLKRIAPEKTVARLVTKNFTLNRTALRMVAKSGVVTSKSLTSTALKVIRDYKTRFSDEVADGASKTEAFETATNDAALMVQRVQNTVVNRIAKEIHATYRGERYVWLPSDAEVPDPIHQLNYGKKFYVGVGEMPGDRYGCRCGMQILVDDEELEL